MTLDLTMPKGEIERLRARRDALAKENAALRTLLAECRPYVLAEIGEWERLRERSGLHPDGYTVARSRIASGNALLDRIDAAGKS